MDKKQQVKMVRSFFSAHGIVLNETNLFFTSGRWIYKTYEFEMHLGLMIDALKFAICLPDQVSVSHEQRKVTISICGCEALVYRKHWIFDCWVCKRPQPHRVEVNTVTFGDSVGDLLDILVGVMSSTESTHVAQTV